MDSTTPLQDIYRSAELFELRKYVQEKTGVSIGEVLLCKNYSHETGQNMIVDRLLLKILKTIISGARDYYDACALSNIDLTPSNYVPSASDPPTNTAQAQPKPKAVLTLEEAAEMMRLSPDELVELLQLQYLDGN